MSFIHRQDADRKNLAEKTAKIELLPLDKFLIYDFVFMSQALSRFERRSVNEYP